VISFEAECCKNLAVCMCDRRGRKHFHFLKKKHKGEVGGDFLASACSFWLILVTKYFSWGQFYLSLVVGLLGIIEVNVFFIANN